MSAAGNNGATNEVDTSLNDEVSKVKLTKLDDDL